MELHTIGIDLGKTVFHLVGLDLRGEVVVRKKFSRTQLLRFTANVHVGLIGMEACGGSHFLGRALREQRHEVRLIPAQYVKPYVKTNKSDYIDAEAIAEAVARPTMRFVPIKTDDQLDLQSLHRVRERWVMRRTAVVNQIRGLLLERGITLRKGRHHVDAALPLILEDADAKLSGAVRLLLAQLKLDLDQLSVRIDEADEVIKKTADENEACRRLVAIPGIGPVTATALIAAIGNGGAFHKGREFAAWMGVVPREHSTGGQQKLLPADEPGKGGVDFVCRKGTRDEFVVEVTSLKPEAVAAQSDIPVSIDDSERGTFQMTTNQLFSTVKEKADQLADYPCPRVLAITSTHHASAHLLGPSGAEFLLTSEPKITYPIAGSGAAATMTTNLRRSAFFGPGESGTQIVSRRRSVSAVLLVALSDTQSAVVGLLHSDPVEKLKIEPFRDVPFLRLANWPIVDGAIKTEWIVSIPDSKIFYHAPVWFRQPTRRRK
jgi:transposase